jgi:hypothetical protein
MFTDIVFNSNVFIVKEFTDDIKEFLKEYYPDHDILINCSIVENINNIEIDKVNIEVLETIPDHQYFVEYAKPKILYCKRLNLIQRIYDACRTNYNNILNSDLSLLTDEEVQWLEDYFN